MMKGLLFPQQSLDTLGAVSLALHVRELEAKTAQRCRCAVQEDAVQEAVFLTRLTLRGHPVAEGVGMEGDQVAELEPAGVVVFHLGDAGNLVLGEVVPVIVA